MRKFLLVAAAATLSLGAVAATPAVAEACEYGSTRWVTKGSFLGELFGYNPYRSVQQTCGGYTWKDTAEAF